MKWDKEIEEKIQAAFEAGAFDNLPGRGEPLSLDQNPFEDPEWALAFRLLKSNEFTLPWVEKKRAIGKHVDEARLALRRAWAHYISSEQVSFDDWEQAATTFRGQSETINRDIRTYNLEVPLTQLQMGLIDVEREIEVIQKKSA